MATEEKNSDATEPTKKKKLLPVAIAVSLGLLAGGGAGAFAAGSLLPKPVGDDAAASAPQPAAEAGGAPHGEGAAGEEGVDGEHGSPADSGAGPGPAGGATYLMENLVLNPAGTGGTRFLMVSVAFGVKDAAASDAMKARDFEVRDALLGVLGTKTVAQLANIAVRDSLKTELRQQVGGLFPKGTVQRVYFPQFVIQ